MSVFILVGSSQPGQGSFKDAPGYEEALNSTKNVKSGIFVYKRKAGENSLVLVSTLQVGHIGWLTQDRVSGKIIATGDGFVHSFNLTQEGTLTDHKMVKGIDAGVHLEVSQDGLSVLVADYYRASLAVYPMQRNGTIEPAVDSKLHRLLDPIDKFGDRQEACHSHQVRLCPVDNRWALCCDLGADIVYVYKFDGESLIGACESERHLRLPRGSGPRHLDFHPSNKFVFILGELTPGKIYVCRWNSETGNLSSPIQEVPVLEGECSRVPHSGNAHILCSQDGRTLYASARTPIPGQISVFRINVNGDHCELVQIQSVSTKGICPRNFSLTKTHLIVGNQDSQSLTTFMVNDDGTLDDGESVVVDKLDGVCPAFVCTIAT